jgi:hypothetical protein
MINVIKQITVVDKKGKTKFYLIRQNPTDRQYKEGDKIRGELITSMCDWNSEKAQPYTPYTKMSVKSS